MNTYPYMIETVIDICWLRQCSLATLKKEYENLLALPGAFRSNEYSFTSHAVSAIDRLLQ